MCPHLKNITKFMLSFERNNVIITPNKSKQLIAKSLTRKVFLLGQKSEQEWSKRNIEESQHDSTGTGLK